MLSYIDTHAHVNFSGFKGDVEETIARAHEKGVWVINVGTQFSTSEEAVRLAENYEKEVFAVIGLHPVHTYSQELDEEATHFKTREEKFDFEVYKKLAQNSKVVGIGECGLDYYRLPGDMNNESGDRDYEKIKLLQKDAFIAQIRLARELSKALVIHCRPSVGSQDAYEDILKILDREFHSLEQRWNGNDHSALQTVSTGIFRWEIHSFTGSPEIVQEFVKRGTYVGFNGIITFDKTGNMEKVIKTVPLEKMVLETDCPFLTPIPFRGKKNEPAYVEYVGAKLAETLGLSEEQLAEKTSANARKLFAI